MKELARNAVARLRQWLRLGPSRFELRAEIELWRERCDRRSADARAAHARAKEAQAEARRARHEASETVRQVRKEADELVRRIRSEVWDRLNEPGRAGECEKVRFHQEAEAEAWAASVAASTGEDPETYHPYQCKVCPRSPVTVSRYWHIGHRGTEAAQEEKKAARIRAARRQREASGAGKLLEQRVDPEVAERLRAMAQEG